MKTPKLSKKIVGTSAVALGLLLGAAGVANAVTGPSTPGLAQTSTSTQTQTPAPDVPEDETNEVEENETPEQEAAEDAAEQELLNSFPVSPDQASAAALAAVPGTVDEVEIEEDGAMPVFEVEIIDANGQEVKVTVDPNTGAVIDQVVEGPDDDAAEDAAEQALLNSFPVSPDQASAAALAAVPGTVDEVEIEEDGAMPVFEVEIIDANGQEVKVTVDPNSGAVIDQVMEGPDDEANEGPEANEANETPEATEVPGSN